MIRFETSYSKFVIVIGLWVDMFVFRQLTLFHSLIISAQLLGCVSVGLLREFVAPLLACRSNARNNECDYRLP